MEERKRRAKNRRFFFVVGAAKQQGCLKLAKRKSHGRKPVVVYCIENPSKQMALTGVVKSDEQACLIRAVLLQFV